MTICIAHDGICNFPISNWSPMLQTCLELNLFHSIITMETRDLHLRCIY